MSEAVAAIFEEEPGKGAAFGSPIPVEACSSVGQTSVTITTRACRRRVGLVRETDGDLAHCAGSVVASDLESKDVPVETQGRPRILVREKDLVNGDVHDRHLNPAIDVELLLVMSVLDDPWLGAR